MTDSEIKRFEISFQVPSWDCGPTGRMVPAAMLRYFQEGAMRHSDAAHGAFDRVSDFGLFWVMAGMRAEFETLPMRGESVHITTWHGGRGPLLFYRAFKAVGDDGRTLASAVSSFALVSLETRRMVRTSAFPVKVPVCELGAEHEALVPERLGTMEVPDGGLHWQAGFRDLDINGHVNNVRYAEWVLESVPPEVLMNRALARLELEFKSEIRFGERLRSVGVAADTSGLFEHAVVKEGDVLACRARTLWRQSGI
ncbi:acyl-[acyl-carrier-protein] thioesterase [Desulfoluna butyratoxydans]|uniref:Acyl-acp thioesterase n=1 Tax=Desulfoluna butyratoxydans TaxID=231438 RepID=A0A4V6IKX4_9BACT|nr:acyl-ACP thioesterase domain-containing protein [Desulfoluna butyratoxydans]VFQ42718.1 acyl-acp thioesterase [Desulfoluna butyratoxydans]